MRVTKNVCLPGLIEQRVGLKMLMVADVEVGLNDSFEMTGQDFPGRPGTSSLMSDTELCERSPTLGG